MYNDLKRSRGRKIEGERVKEREIKREREDEE